MTRDKSHNARQPPKCVGRHGGGCEIAVLFTNDHLMGVEMFKETPVAACHARAQRQHGVLTRQQALDAGMTRRMIERQIHLHLWHVIFPSVYLVGGVAPLWTARLQAAVLGGGTSCVASHRAAARLHHFEACLADTIEISAHRFIRWSGVVAHRAHVPSADRTSVDAIRCTTPSRTLIDLASVVDLFRLEAALDGALISGLTSVRYLERLLDRRGRRGRPGTGALARLLATRTAGRPPSESELERLFERNVRNPYALPACSFQHRVHEGSDDWRIDFAYPHASVGVEVLGWKFHQGRRAWERDLHRHNGLASLGWTILYFTWTDIAQRPAAVAREIKQALRRYEAVLFTDDHPTGVEM